MHSSVLYMHAFFFVVLQVIKKCKQVIKEHLKAIDPTVVYPFLLLFALLAGNSLWLNQ